MRSYSITFLILLLLNCSVRSQVTKNIDTVYERNAIMEDSSLPTFYRSLSERLNFPLSWSSGKFEDFEEWKVQAREKVYEHLIADPPPKPFDMLVIDKEDRGSYMAHKMVLNISADSRVLAYMLVPKGTGPFPAVLLLHDHGSFFEIGKEKVIRPFNVSEDRMSASEDWVKKSYGGRFIGDELAKRGYICFATDMLNWGDRAGGGYEGQQAIASNLFHLGSSFAGLITYEDLRAAEFLANFKDVDPSRIAAMGHSVGAFRAWQLAALSSHIKLNVSNCWMTTIKGSVIPGNNITRGQSAYTMTHPGLYNYLDYPDIASIACPKPALFYNGSKDVLFPVPSVQDAYQKMHTIWSSQNADDSLLTKIWDEGHVFSKTMQNESFEWLDVNMKN